MDWGIGCLKSLDVLCVSSPETQIFLRGGGFLGQITLPSGGRKTQKTTSYLKFMVHPPGENF
jgi:hypothetical protein